MTKSFDRSLGLAAGGRGSCPSRRRMLRAARRPAGLTLVEVLVASAVLGTVVVAATHSLTMTAAAQHEVQAQPSTAFELARDVFRVAQTLGREAGDGLPAESLDELLLLEDLDGAELSPPIDGLMQERDGLDSWTQRTFVRRVGLADPTTTQADGDLYELTVVIDEGPDTVGTYRWWLPAD